MTRDNGAKWRGGLHARIAEAVRNTRRGRSAQQIADETERLGYPITRSQIANYESGRKQGLDVSELLILAAALEVPPVTLLFGGHPDDDVEVLPGRVESSVAALAWFTGDSELAWPGPDLDPLEVFARYEAAAAAGDSPPGLLLGLIRDRAAQHREIARARNTLGLIATDTDEYARAIQHIGNLTVALDRMNRLIDATVKEAVRTSHDE